MKPKWLLVTYKFLNYFYKRKLISNFTFAFKYQIKKSFAYILIVTTIF